MSKWERTCKSFIKVRKLIDEEIRTIEQCVKILQALETCCDELTPDYKIPWFWYEDFRDMKSELHKEIELLGVDEDCQSYEDCEEFVNSVLQEWYDLCDSARVWCGL